MKSIITLLFACCFSLAVSAQKQASKINIPDPSKKTFIVDAACGECRFKLKGKGCDLAIRWKGKAYFVEGTKIDDYGDAHADDGFCEAVRKAEVQGEVKGDRFVATYFKLVE